MRKTLILVLWACAVGLLLLGCDGRSGLTDVAASAFVTDAKVTVDGEVVNGRTVSRGHGGGATRFEASVRFAGRAPSVVRVRYTKPGAMGMHGSGELSCYDDGTHGDRQPGDGVYCYEDHEGRYGCHGDDAHPGQHRYEFDCADDRGRRSNPVVVTVQVTD